MTDPILINFESLVNISLQPFVRDHTVKARVYWDEDGYVQIVFNKAKDFRYLGGTADKKALSTIIVSCAKLLKEV